MIQISEKKKRKLSIQAKVLFDLNFTEVVNRNLITHYGEWKCKIRCYIYKKKLTLTTEPGSVTGLSVTVEGFDFVPNKTPLL